MDPDVQTIGQAVTGARACAEIAHPTVASGADHSIFEPAIEGRLRDLAEARDRDAFGANVQETLREEPAVHTQPLDVCMRELDAVLASLGET